MGPETLLQKELSALLVATWLALTVSWLVGYMLGCILRRRAEGKESSIPQDILMEIERPMTRDEQRKIDLSGVHEHIKRQEEEEHE